MSASLGKFNRAASFDLEDSQATNACLSLGLIDLHSTDLERLFAIALIGDGGAVLVAGTVQWRRAPAKAGAARKWSASSDVLKQIAHHTAGRRVVFGPDAPGIGELLTPLFAQSNSATGLPQIDILRTALWRGTTMSAIDAAKAVAETHAEGGSNQTESAWYKRSVQDEKLPLRTRVWLILVLVAASWVMTIDLGAGLMSLIRAG